MKEYLKRLARGSFVYEEPKLAFSDESLEVQAVSGAVLQLEFVINATDKIKGIVWSSNERVVPESRTFAGIECRIAYSIDTRGLRDKDIISGAFDIVSSAGEASLPYEIKVVSKVCETTVGEVANIFHFANLCQNSIEEAETIFDSEDFKEIVLKNDKMLANLYDVLRHGRSKNCAIEELLVAAHKKPPVTIRLSEESISYSDITESISESVEIIKSGWGYTNISAESDVEFIKLVASDVTGEKFTGSHYSLPYLIDYSRLHSGKNLGRIILTTYNQRLTYEIEVDCRKEYESSREKYNALTGLTKEYLAYRMRKKDVMEWVESSTQILDRIRGIEPDNIYFKLVQAQMFLAVDRQQEGQWLLENAKSILEKQELDKSVRGVELYCYYLYVNSLALRDEAYTAKAAAIVKGYYENGCDTWRLLWLLFYLDNSYNRNISIKLLRIKDVCHNGCISPIMYIEALAIMNAQPALLRVLNNFELRVLMFGFKYGIVSKKLAMQAVEIISNEKCATIHMINLLKKLNETYENDEVLTCLVTQMVRNGIVGGGSFELYEKGILRGLKITQLYEYYIKSMDKSKMLPLPKIVLMYFSYDTAMDYADKAYIYANIITNEKDKPEVMNIYLPNIEHFGYEQLKCGNIDDNLLIIYSYIKDEHLIDESTAENMLKLIFTYKVKCFDTDAVEVVVKHKELDITESYPVVDNVAYVQIYTDNCAIAFKDARDCIRKDSIRYEIEKVFSGDEMLSLEKIRAVDNVYTRLNRYENRNRVKADSSGLFDDVSNLLKDININSSVRYELNSWLIDYYNTYYVGEDFSLCYSQLCNKGLYEEDAVKLIELCITQELYRQAYELVCEYGYSRTAPLKVFRLARHIIEQRGDEENDVLLEMCSFSFANKTYNEEILDYLVMYYNGTNEQMYEVWKACQNFKVDSLALAERIVAQMLFTGEHNGRMTEVFCYYCTNGGRVSVIQSYVAYHSYLYFIKQKRANDIVFKVIEQFLSDGKELPDMCALALLKSYSSHIHELNKTQLELAENLINIFCRENKLFEFFKKFGEILPVPYNIIDQTVIEYYDNPKARVELHYTEGSDENNEQVEIMNNICGVFTKTFTLFYGESVSYYFVVECDGKVKRTSVSSIVNNNINPDRTESRFDYINDMLASRELHDMVTMKKLMHGYTVQDYVVKQIFKPML